VKRTHNKTLLAAACAAALTGAAAPAGAADWLMLQGTEPAGQAPRIKVWGFIQAQYQKDYSDPNPSDGSYIPPKLIGPNLTTQSQFGVNRARLGARGTGFPLDPNVNYFLLAEFGNNAITNANEGSIYITDASVTLNHLKKFTRVRMGLFKTPGPEEGLQAIHVFDYINFTSVGNQLMLERFPNYRYTPNFSGTGDDTLTGDLNQFERPVGAFRDTGIQFFNNFKLQNNWEWSYAFMVGNGNGLNFGDRDDNKDTYGYLSVAKVFGGKGPWREDWKFFAWTQNGKRTIDSFVDDDADGIDDGYSPEEHDRKRWGVGTKYLKKPFRFTAEYMDGEGMIFVGPDKPTFDQNGSKPEANGLDGKASGWYVEGGWYIPNTNWEIDARYDVYNRLEDDPGPPGGPNAGRSFESVWKTWTLGVQYHFNKKTRATLNYQIRNVESPDWPAGAGPNANMDGIKNRLALQLTHIF